MPDVIAFGEAMVRLATPHFQRIEQSRTFDVEIGGAELNTAVGLARLGRSAAWVSRLPDNPLGQLVANRVREAGVEPRVRFTDDGRCGLYFLESGASPRASSILYDRKDSSIARVQSGDFDWPTTFAGAKWFHVTGITPALSENAAAVTGEALRAAKAAGVRTSIDLNYRSKLWTREEAGRTMSELLRSCDLLLASEPDAEHLFGITGRDFAEVAARLIDTFGVTMVAGVRRSTPLVWRNTFGAIGFTGGKLFTTADYEVEIVDRLGAGDALAAGLIDGILAGDFQYGLDFGAAMGAIKHSIPGDLPWISRGEVEELLKGHGLRIRR
ncbi:sugar kinase [Limnoglobus roseus]|uniref:Sugar kinase n=1 Tax=Limnoglobus roseus TaxID=2598579 RepID=A0A5C1AD01_9BACT|nr:sugar kinase [Limnoglobus roseus]QEL16580.1 sugar kinase [Limnoglobus roseus]